MEHIHGITKYIEELEKEKKELSGEIVILKNKLQKYTNPSRNKKFQEKNKEKISKKKKEYYKKLSKEKKREYAKRAYEKKKLKIMEEKKV